MDKINCKLLRENETLVNGVDALCYDYNPDYVKVKAMVKTWLDHIGFKESVGMEYAPDFRLLTIYSAHPSELIGAGHTRITFLEDLYFQTFGEICKIEVNDIVGAIVSPSNKE